MADLPYMLEVVTAPVGDVITVDDMWTVLRTSDDAEADYLADLIRAATEYVEKNSGKQLLTATYDLKLHCFPCREIWFPRLPVQSVASVKYLDYSGAEQTVDASQYDVQRGTEHAKGYVLPAYAAYWPVARNHDWDVTVRFVCGFGTADDVPAAMKQQIRMLVKHWFENRSAVACGAMSRAELAYDALQQFTMHHEFI